MENLVIGFAVWLFGLLCGFLPSYISRKGANYADKEDMAEITRQIENVKLANATVLEAVKAAHQNQSSLAAISHIANTVFDKHVEFCEEYVQESLAALYCIFREGATTAVLDHSIKLLRVREKHAVWISPKVQSGLEPFETALRQMGASAGYVKSTTGDSSALQRQEHINRMYKILAQVTGTPEWDGETLTDELAVSTQIRYLSGILGTEQFHDMRQAIVAKMVKEMQK